MSLKKLHSTATIASGIMHVRAGNTIWTINLANIERYGVYSPRLDRDGKTILFRWHNGPYSEGTQITLDTPETANSLLKMIR